MSEMEEIVEIVTKPHPTAEDWKRFYELRQVLIDRECSNEINKMVDNLVEVRYIGG